MYWPVDPELSAKMARAKEEMLEREQRAKNAMVEMRRSERAVKSSPGSTPRSSSETVVEHGDEEGHFMRIQTK